LLKNFLKMAFMEFRRGKMKSVLYVLLITISSTLLIIVSHLAFSSYGVMEDQLNESDTSKKNNEMDDKIVSDMILTICSKLLNSEQIDVDNMIGSLDEILIQLNLNKLEDTELYNRIQTILQIMEPITKDNTTEAIYMIQSLFIDENFIEANTKELNKLIDKYKELYLADKETELPKHEVFESAGRNVEPELSPILEAHIKDEIQVEKYYDLKPGRQHLSGDTSLREAIEVFDDGNKRTIISTYSEDKNLENIINMDRELDMGYFSVGEAEFKNSNVSITINKDNIFMRNKIINKEEVFNKILEDSRVLNNGEMKEIRIKLKPDSLGKLTIRLIMENGGMTARFITENYKAKDAIESNFSQLQDVLHEKGVNIQELSVFIGNEGKWQHDNQYPRLFNKSKKDLTYGFNEDKELDEELDLYNNPYSISESYLDIRI